MNELGGQETEFPPQTRSARVTSKDVSTSNRQDLRVRRIPKSERKLSRREFLKILGGAGLLAGATALGIRVYGSGKETGERHEDRQDEAVFLPVKGEAVTQHREQFGFHPEETKRFIQEQGLPPEAYGKLAAAGVTFMSIAEEEDAYFIREASGGIAEYKGEYYLVSTMHVLADALHKETKDKTQLTVNIPGLEQMYLCKPREIHTFNPWPSPKYDSPVFIKLAGEIVEKVKELTAKGDLHPLQPLPIYEGFDQPITLFRFQGGRNGLHDYVINYSVDEANVDLYNMSSDTPSSCPGVSGAVGLEKKNGQLTGVFRGVFTHLSQRIYGTETTEFALDVHGVLGDGNICSRAAGLTSFGEKFFAWGMTKTELP